VNFTKFATAAIIAGVLMGAYGLVTNTSAYEPADAPTPLQGTTSLQPITGLAPIEDVIELFQERSDAHAKDYISRTQLGVALNAQARESADLAGYAEAEGVLRDALELNPRYSAAKLALAGSLHSQHEFGQALLLATEVQDSDPSELSALALIGDANFELGNYVAAESNYNELVAIERSAPTVSRLARLASIQGDNAGAVELATEALELSDGFPMRPNAASFYWFQVGHFQFNNGQVDESISSLETALEIDPDSSGTKEKLASIAYATGDLERAGDLYLELIETGPAPDLFGSYADIMRSQGNDERAAEFDELGQALAVETLDDFPAERRHLVDFFLTRDPQLARDLAQADLVERQDVGAYDTLAWALFHTGDFAESQAAIEMALAEGTQDASMLFHAAAIANANGDAAAAATFAQQALTINPSFHLTDVETARDLALAG